MPDQLVFDPWGLALIIVCAMLVGAVCAWIGSLFDKKPAPDETTVRMIDIFRERLSQIDVREKIAELEGLFVAKGAHIDGLELRIAAVEELKADQFEQRFDAIFSRLNGISDILTKDDGRLTALETPPPAKPKPRKH